MIELRITAESAEELFTYLNELAAPTLPAPGKSEPVKQAPIAAAPVAAVEQSDSVAEASPAATDDGTVDAHGHPWSADMHASTKTMTKEGLWRMKVGVTRPEPLPGFPKSDSAGSISTANTGEAESSQSEVAAVETAGAVEEDEFAAFRAASQKVEAEGAAAAASIPARKWTDADLGALCNQAAVKLGDPAPVKVLIEKFVPEGEVAHSRNIFEDQREDFAKAVEAKAGITFAG